MFAAFLRNKVEYNIGISFVIRNRNESLAVFIYVGMNAESAARQAAAFACLHYRKPKRIRTAFSPTQLVRLEDAFDNNQYVVGQERKDLAASLSLTETQVRTCTAACRPDVHINARHMLY